ncbi:MAG: hypothetical protein HY646_22405 [Acidobacteria bacterium]|nr:hypothetical protein [Acidobacteriota bacterium]
MPIPFPDRPRGFILAGRLSGGLFSTTLHLEAPELKDSCVKITGERGGHVVSVDIRRGRGFINKPAEIRSLFKENVPHQTGDSWGGILWERIDREFIPFPISVLLIANDSGMPDQTLMDLVWEELGVWPPHTDGESTDDNEMDNQPNDDEDLDLLARAKHEGKLDRLAVAVSVLRKRVLNGNVGAKYADARIQIFRSQIEKLHIEAHIKKVLLQYLNVSKSHGKSTK